MYEAKNSKICNFWTFWPVIQLIIFSKSDKKPFCPMLHRGKKCSETLKRASVGRGETAYLKACHFSPPTTNATFKISMHFLQLETIVKKVLVQF